MPPIGSIRGPQLLQEFPDDRLASGLELCRVATWDAIGTLIEFNTSCAPVFAQRGALAALASAGESVAPLVAHWRACRDTLCDALAPLPGVLVARPPGGLYAFLQLEGGTDSLGLAKRLVNEHGLGLALAWPSARR